jgi:hypothetical protein
VDDVGGAKTFGVAGSTYDSYMGRYSRALAELFADAGGVESGHTAVDIGCGPGALTRVLVDRLGAEAVAACIRRRGSRPSAQPDFPAFGSTWDARSRCRSRPVDSTTPWHNSYSISSPSRSGQQAR